jgi:hypothetical protein
MPTKKPTKKLKKAKKMEPTKPLTLSFAKVKYTYTPQ